MKRNEKIDVLRGWAIILVVFGHCMEYASGHEFFSVNGIYNNLIFKVIYSFRMPLFACISGWLFGSTIEKYASFDIIRRKAESLIIPIASWITLWMLLNAGLSIIRGNIDFAAWVKGWFGMFLTNFWFLWAIFVCMLLVVVVHHFFGDNIGIYLLSIAGMLVIPDSEVFAGGGAGTKFLYPFFVSVYLMRIHKVDLAEKVYRYKVIICIAFIVLLGLYQFDTYIYVSGFDIYGNLSWVQYIGYDLQRYGIGCAGSTIMLLVVWKFYRQNLIHKIISAIGRESIGIYILSSKIISGVCYSVFKAERVNYILDIILTVGILVICHAAIYIIKKVPLANKMLLGGI